MQRKLIIGVDVRDLRIARTGTKTVLEEFCREFKKTTDPSIQFYFFDTRIPVYTGKNFFLKLTEHLRYQVWKQLVLPLKAWLKKCTIVFCNDYFVPLIHLRYTTVPVFHDTFFYEYPEQSNALWLWLFKHVAVPAARRSAIVVTPSHYSKKRLCYYKAMSEKQIVPVYIAPKTLDQQVQSTNMLLLPPLLQALISAHTPYILHIGTMEKRKNLPFLIQSFMLLKKMGYSWKLVLAGQRSPKIFLDDYEQIQQIIRKYGLEKDVLLTGYLPDDQLPLWYQNASLYVFPSVYEGFGIPVIEAFQYGLPVLVANNTCLPEIGGDAVISFDPYDAGDLSRCMKQVIDDPMLRQEMIQKGKSRMANFSWEKSAAQLVELFKSIAKQARSR